MVNDELIFFVKERFKQGERRNQIKEELLNEGYLEDDIEAAIGKIQHDAFKQLPGISWIYRLIDDFESKKSLATPHMTVLLMIACIVFLFLVAGALYFVFDPLGMRSTARDTQRQSDITKLQNALITYYKKNNQYPDNLTNLVPEFLSSLPHDPQTGATYSYKVLDDKSNFELCISFELQQPQCVYAAPVSSEIPDVPTATSVPTFVPQSASVSPSIHEIQ